MKSGKIIPFNSRNNKVYLLPNILTTVALCFGFLSIISTINADYQFTVKFILFALIADGLDGRVARLTNTQSDFGKQYDSLADMISFGVAPALFVMMVTKQYLHHASWGVAFAYTALAAIRLAKFNTQSFSSNFSGLPSPVAAVFLVITTLLVVETGLDFNLALALLGLVLLLGILMISTIKYPGFKTINFDIRSPFSLLIIVACCVLLMINFYQSLWFILFSFICYGLIRFMLDYRHSK